MSRKIQNYRQIWRQRRHYSVLSSFSDIQNAKPYSYIPGPQPIPVIGNTWRLMPIVGQYDISDIAKVLKTFSE